MLRTSLQSARTLGAPARQSWAALSSRRVLVTRRYFADDKKPSVDAVKANASTVKPSVEYPKPKAAPIDPAAAATTPKVNATPDATAKAANTPPPPPPSKEKKGILRRLRNFIFTLTVLGALSFGGGVWYARINDKFHDLFTTYVPLGENVVLYLEELDFRKRFPDSSDRVSKAGGSEVTIPAASGASWRVADGGEPAGRRSSAVGKSKPKPKEPIVKEEPKPAPAVVDPPKVVEKAAAPATPEPVAVVPVVAVEPEVIVAAVEPQFKAPEVNEPSRYPPLATIDALSVADAKEPIVQDLVRMVNDLITVINADKAHGRYGSTITKAKSDVEKVGRKLDAMRAEIEKKAVAEVKVKLEEFDKAANALVERVESAMVAQERSWRAEFEEEMAKVRESYDEKARVLLERERRLQEEKTTTKLLEQALALKKEFISEVRGQVEKEREGRLGKLDKLSSAVKELEALTAGWNDVVDANIKTQHLHVAVEAVKASLEDATHAKPFIKELVALKQIADGDPVVDAAIASINPSAYQKGVATPAQLIDRFRRVATEVRKASLLPDDAGVASHATSWALSKVMFKKEGLVAGDDVESVLGRAQMYLEEGDLDSAAREVNGLEGWAKTLSVDWLGEVRKVLEVRQALEVIATEARLQSLRVD
ncbi:related to Formation of crista junctions protein 1 [Cephalotrichum gorgonifer]|uniref:MICOS complex subunit MIC60 n=1 Tax=Cephalotrichum gorgonifer TaxID=2041049 RepID=A0AAE8MZI0_9PEZI|nr:related to Formation of crista junctions protein 1 [Cephalotrichum gorgonifer]